MRFKEIRNEERGEERLMPRFDVEEIEKEFSPESFKGVGLAPNFSKRSKEEERSMPRFSVEEIEKEFSPESFRM
jgi:hypothetical protein